MHDRPGRRLTSSRTRRLAALLTGAVAVAVAVGWAAAARPSSSQPSARPGFDTAATLATGSGQSAGGARNGLDDGRPAATLPADLPTVAVPSGAHMVDVPVVMYHYIRVNPERGDRLGFNLSVTPGDFNTQMDLLAAAGFHTVTMADLLDAMDGRRALPAHPIVLTFDDGYADFASTAMPLLVRHRFIATDYVVSGFIGRPNYMSADQVRALPAAGMVIGAHTVHHVDLAMAPPTLATQEITQSRQALEALVQRPVLDFAYPSGRFNGAVEKMVIAAGFRDAVTTVEGTAHQPAQPFAITRVRVRGGESLRDFAHSVGIPAEAIPASLLARPTGAAAPVPTPTPRPVPPIRSGPIAVRPGIFGLHF